ncbi:hypothetical protein NDU88_001737 [Pleurodeles waltl]|uniref:Uncharacterized protein n=1 Tax=Pleurodeles waltl TaxID=8319 RepID=A0AAV7M200_PLEWA|nr:hypothetical protein NDU88_001737 [Pleurodeles waltl]
MEEVVTSRAALRHAHHLPEADCAPQQHPSGQKDPQHQEGCHGLEGVAATPPSSCLLHRTTAREMEHGAYEARTWGGTPEVATHYRRKPVNCAARPAQLLALENTGSTSCPARERERVTLLKKAAAKLPQSAPEGAHISYFSQK